MSILAIVQDHRLAEETETDGLVAGVPNVSGARDCKTGSATCITVECSRPEGAQAMYRTVMQSGLHITPHRLEPIASSSNPA